MKPKPIRVTTNQFENNLFITTSKSKPKAGVSIIPYENELGFRQQEENDSFMPFAKKNRYQQRSERNNKSSLTLTRSRSKTHYENNNNNIRQQKRQKYKHSTLQINIENEEDDFQEINCYINKYSKTATTKDDKTINKKGSNSQNKNDHILSHKKNNNSITSNSNKSNIIKTYGLRASSSSSTTVRATPKISATVPKTKRESLFASTSPSMDEKRRMKKPISLSTAKRSSYVSSNEEEEDDSDGTTSDDSSSSNNSSSISNSSISISSSSGTNNNNDEKDSNKTEACKENFVLPEKRPKKSQTLFAPLPKFSDPLMPEKLRSNGKNLVKCPYCHSLIDIYESETVAVSYEQIKGMDIKDDDNRTITTTTASSVLTKLNNNVGNNTSTKKSTKRTISNMELYDFCRLHTSELEIKPYCQQQGWPITIVFGELKERIHALKEDLDNIIYQKINSSYRTLALAAYQKMGKHKARSTIGVLSRFEETLPGYYGTKGSYIIQNHLVKMYLYKGILNKDLTKPQLPMEYIQQVLVPEVGYRLIREDLIKHGKKKSTDPNIDDIAKQIMIKSSEAGSYLQPLTDDVDDFDHIDDEYNALYITTEKEKEEQKQDDIDDDDGISAFDKNEKNQVHILIDSDDNDTTDDN
ncbi:unnamed protein product [Cunninghamella echinulata]